jgi:hypothetical protein
MSEKESAADLVDQMDFEDQPVRKYVRRSYICRLPNSMNAKRSVTDVLPWLLAVQSRTAVLQAECTFWVTSLAMVKV